MQDPANLFGIDGDGHGGLLGSVHHCGNASSDAHAARYIFRELALAGRCGDDFRCAHGFLFSLLLTFGHGG